MVKILLFWAAAPAVLGINTYFNEIQMVGIIVFAKKSDKGKK